MFWLIFILNLSYPGTGIFTIICNIPKKMSNKYTMKLKLKQNPTKIEGNWNQEESTKENYLKILKNEVIGTVRKWETRPANVKLSG